MASSASGGASHGTPSAHAPTTTLRALTDELDRLTPRFDIEASQIHVLKTPTDFYETLKSKISKAQKRIYLSTLYIGKAEHELIAVIRKALEANPDLKVSILTDALRGTRETPEPSCASLLTPLVTDFGPDRIEIRMFHTPNLTGLRKKLVPKRINEGWGLQHMKLYGMDDEIMISGANLSSDYFTNRQDRYHIFSSKTVTDYFHTIHSAVCSLSFLVQPVTTSDSMTSSAPAYALTWPGTNPSISPLISPSAFRTRASTILTPLIRSTSSLPSRPASTTSIYPISQLTSLYSPISDASTELPSLLILLRLLQTPAFHSSSWTFTAGYFNPHPSLTALLLSPPASSQITGSVITASPQANGFYNSPGISGLLPSAYTLLSRRFLRAVSTAGLSQNVTLKEWRHGTVGEQGGWTYHAKGLWMTLPGDEKVGPSVTVVGSSNYTKRSYSLDLECGLLIVTRDESLKKRLEEERRGLEVGATRVTEDDLMRVERRVGMRVRLAMWLVKVLGGAL